MNKVSILHDIIQMVWCECLMQTCINTNSLIAYHSKQKRTCEILNDVDGEENAKIKFSFLFFKVWLEIQI